MPCEQINTPDSLSCATEKGRDTLFDAINKRQDDVYRRLYDEFNSLSLVPLNEIKYHSVSTFFRQRVGKFNGTAHFPV
jgi:hypothetical protein